MQCGAQMDAYGSGEKYPSMMYCSVMHLWHSLLILSHSNCSHTEGAHQNSLTHQACVTKSRALLNVAIFKPQEGLKCGCSLLLGKIITGWALRACGTWVLSFVRGSDCL